MKEGTKAVVVLKPRRILDVARRHRIKVQRDVMTEFVGEAMIVVDSSVFIDLLFEYNSDRTQCAEELFYSLEENGLTILEPNLFKAELTGQIARRVKREQAIKICGEIFQELAFINTRRIFDEALFVVL